MTGSDDQESSERQRLTVEDVASVIECLPLPIYLVSRTGEILAGNQQLCELLHVPRERLSHRNIAEFYADPADRDVLLVEVEGGARLEKRPVTFMVDEHEIQLLMFCRGLENVEGLPAAFIGTLFEVTADIQYHGLFDKHLPVGVYRLDENDVVTQANAAFAVIHGYHSVQDVIKRRVSDFYADPTDAVRIRERIQRQELLRKEPVTLKRADGSTFDANLTAIPFFNRKGRYAGRGGLVEDGAQERQMKQLFDDMPVGFYVVRSEGGKDIVAECNKEFARIHDIDDPLRVVGADIRHFHLNPEETQAFLSKVADAAERNTTVLGERLRIKTPQGNVKTIEINARPIVRDGVICGRVGVIRDISDEVEMRDVIDTLRSDIGAVLHIFRQTLQQLKHNIRGVADVLGKSPKTPTPIVPPEQLADSVRSSLKDLSAAVSAIVEAARKVSHGRPLPESDLVMLEKRLVVMLNCERNIAKPHWRDVWRSAAVDILAICRRIARGSIARSIYRPAVVAAERIATLTALATLGISREAIAAVDAPVISLREFVTSGTRPAEPLERCAIEVCVSDAIANISGFADDRHVQIIFADSGRNYVTVARREVTRAIENLLHNAVKYSWRRDDGRTWVSVTVTGTELATAIVIVENWGVPVPAEEILADLVFRLGFRGRFSGDRGRMGTGVGLSDSAAVARAHGGTVRITSRPANPAADAGDYNQPFLTTTYFELPLAR